MSMIKKIYVSGDGIAMAILQTSNSIYEDDKLEIIFKGGNSRYFYGDVIEKIVEWLDKCGFPVIYDRKS